MTHPLLRLLNHWLYGDRIRVSTSEGQWFRLEVGQRVIAGDRLLVVISREVITKIGRTGVRYELIDYCGIPRDMKPLSASPVTLDCLGQSQISLENRDSYICMEYFGENG